MDLRDNRITVGELLEDPRSKRVLTRRFSKAIHLPIVSNSGSISLQRAMKLVSAYIPQKEIEATVEELRRL